MARFFVVTQSCHIKSNKNHDERKKENKERMIAMTTITTICLHKSTFGSPLPEFKEEERSAHYRKDRKTREYLVNFVVGDGHVIREMYVDRGHPDGPELHSLTDTGVIIIQNYRTKRVITKLIARPGQVRRFYRGETAPNWLVVLAQYHERMEYNN